MKISVVIPLYKNRELFFKNFSQNVKFLKKYEIIIVDDASHENIKDSLIKLFPNIQYIENSKTLGFSKSVNKGCNRAHGDLIILLNTDVRLFKEFPKDLFLKFSQEKDLFGVSFMQIERDGSFVGKNRIFFRNGLPNHSKTDNLEEGANAWLEGGACIVRKEFFHKLKGFNELFSPFYWEDVDLGYRAYSVGWKIIFSPNIVVEHHHESTISKYFSKKYIKLIAYRNQFLFTWLNLSDKKYVLLHLVFLPWVLLNFLIHREITGINGFVTALFLIPNVIKARQSTMSVRKNSDEKIFTIFKKA